MRKYTAFGTHFPLLAMKRSHRDGQCSRPYKQSWPPHKAADENHPRSCIFASLTRKTQLSEAPEPTASTGRRPSQEGKCTRQGPAGAVGGQQWPYERLRRMEAGHNLGTSFMPVGRTFGTISWITAIPEYNAKPPRQQKRISRSVSSR